MAQVKERIQKQKVTTPARPDQSFLPNPDIFKFKVALSFKPVIRLWRLLAKDKNPVRSAMAKSVLEALNSVPELKLDVVDPAIAEQHQELVATLLSVAFSSGLGTEEMGSAFLPYSMIEVYQTPAYLKKIVPPKHMKMEEFPYDMDEMAAKKAMHLYSTITEEFYNFKVPQVAPPFIGIPDAETGLDRFYKLDFINKFSEIVVNGELPKLSQKTLNYLKSNQEDLDLWNEYLPMEMFELRGIGIIKYIDVSDMQLLSIIKLQLLEPQVLLLKEKFLALERNISSLLQVPDLKLGVTIFQKGKGVLSQAGHKVYHSFIARFADETMCSSTMGHSAEELMDKSQPLVIESLREIEEQNTFQQRLLKEGVESLIFAPLKEEDKILGLFEIASSRACDLNQGSYRKLEELLPMFTLAIEREYEEEGNRMERIVKEECTAIHPSVEWRFNQAALRVVEQQNRGEMARMEPIVFEDVYPLYAASDIRGSSTKRNLAIQADLTETLEEAIRVLDLAFGRKPMPILKNLIFRIHDKINHVQKGVGSGDELSVIEFIQLEVNPLFDHLKSLNKELRKAVERFSDIIDPKLGLVYKKRRDFEESLTHINDTVSSFLDLKEAEAQRIFPHYFEKFKTDGVEYNIYVGESIVENDSYDPVYLHNLRLWQLQTTIEVARITHAMKNQLTVPLDTTHLILVHSSPMAIRFRSEEKQFDVDGAYNIRYEIVKKRIDKALIKDTDERLTQPRQIAIVYSTDKDAAEYREYIRYLQSEGFLQGEVEELELEELQGVKGLRALRVTMKEAE